MPGLTHLQQTEHLFFIYSSHKMFEQMLTSLYNERSKWVRILRKKTKEQEKDRLKD